MIEDIDDDQISSGGKTLGLEDDSEDSVEISGGLSDSVDATEDDDNEDDDAELELSEDLLPAPTTSRGPTIRFACI